MRSVLSKFKGQRQSFIAGVGRFGHIRSSEIAPTTTICLEFVTADNQLVADHLWISNSKNIRTAHLRSGDVIKFEATVQRYSKGYAGLNRPPSWDYRLSNVSNIGILGNYLHEDSS